MSIGIDIPARPLRHPARVRGRLAVWVMLVLGPGVGVPAPAPAVAEPGAEPALAATVAGAVAAYRRGGSRQLLENIMSCYASAARAPAARRRGPVRRCADLDLAATVIDRDAVRRARNDGHDDKYPGDPRLSEAASRRRRAAGRVEEPPERTARVEALTEDYLRRSAS